MKIFNFPSMTVKARAVAGPGNIDQNCIYVMSPTASPAVSLQGSFNVSAPQCGIIINSSSSNALQFTGAGGTLVAKTVSVVGGDSGQTGDSSPTPTLGVSPVSNPMGFLTFPDPATLNCSTPQGGSLTGSIGPTLTGSTVCYSGNVTLSNATLAAGTYVFTGNVTLSGTVSTGTGGATLILNSGSLTESTGATLNLVAPTTGPFNGLVLAEPIGNTNQLAFDKGNSFGGLTGIIYAPSAQLFLQDSGGDKSGGLTLTTDLVVNTIYDKTATMTVTSYSQTTPTSPLKASTLVE